jgi:signal transduction histidine kinase
MEAIIISAGLAYRFNRYRVDKEKILVEMSRRQHENTRVLMSVQEAERNYIANQLHDVAGSLLSAAKLNLSSLREKALLPDRTVSAQLEKAEEAVTLVSDMVRDLSHALSPVMLKQTGFKSAIEKVVSIFNASGELHIRLIIIGFEDYKVAFSN